MGIQQWEPRAVEFSCEKDQANIVDETAVGGEVKTISADAMPQPLSAEQDISNLDWQALKERVMACRSCGLHETRTNPVFGVGSENARVMFIGEAPGADEDMQGEPFVGRAGKLLDEMLFAIGLKREQVFIANILKCRPPNNRDPHLDEVVCCEPYLRRQIDLIKPELIVALGRIAAHNLLKTDISLGRLRGELRTCPVIDVPVLVTYHPAYLLRSPLEKRKAWVDFQAVIEIIQGKKS